MREAWCADSAAPIPADEYFEALLASLEKISALKVVQISTSMNKVSKHMNNMERDLVLSFNCLRKCSYDIWRSMGPFAELFAVAKPTLGGMPSMGPGSPPRDSTGGFVAAVSGGASATTDANSQASPIKRSLHSSEGSKTGISRLSSGQFRQNPTAEPSVPPPRKSRVHRKVRTLYDKDANAKEDEVAPTAEDEPQEAMAMTHGEIENAKKEKQLESDALIWDRFDVFYGIFVIANGLLMGLRADRVAEDATTLWTLIDSAFFTIFCFELLQRAVLVNQLENYSDDTVVLGLFPRMERSEIMQWLPDTFRNTRRFMRDPWVVLDVFIILLGALEYVLRWFGESFDGRMASVFRIFRLLRLIRIVRLFKVLKELWLLMEGMVQAIGTLFWATLMLGIMVYVGSVIVKESVDKEDFITKWDTLDNSMFRMLQIITFDSDSTGMVWFSMITEVSAGNWLIFLFLIGFVVATALGLMNLIVGIMVEQSYNIVQTEKNRLRGDAIILAKQAMLHAKSAFASLQDRSATKKTKNMEEQARSIMVTPAQFRDAMRADPHLRAALERGGITSYRIKHIFTKLSIEGPQQPIHLSDFIEACLRLTQGLKPVDLIACKVNFRRLAQELESLETASHEMRATLLDFPHRQQHWMHTQEGSGDYNAETAVEYRLPPDEHPAFLDIANMKLRQENDGIRDEIKALQKLVKDHLGEFADSASLDEFAKQRAALKAKHQMSPRVD
ncbi:unnamed protein product [Amoebophrya sp. A25]|nr:unnamed protein product [Amoebophrya sp. A25]|eukprot:GSA25T00021112001.1